MKHEKWLPLMLAWSGIAVGSAAAQAYLPVSQSKLVDGTGTLVASATVCAAPVDNMGNAISVQPGGGGTVISSAVCTNATAGAWTLNLPNTAISSPRNACFAVTATDNVSGASLIGPGYSCVQPTTDPSSVWCTGTACNFDLLPPMWKPLLSAYTQGPQGKQGLSGAAGPPALFRGAYSPTTTYAAGDVVGYKSSSYASLVPGNVGNLPSSSANAYWGLVAGPGIGFAGLIDITAPPYNAVGDGVADDGPALQAAFAAASLNYSTVIIPNGVYLVKTGIIDVGGQVGGGHLNGRSVIGGGVIQCAHTVATDACVRVTNGGNVAIQLGGIIGSSYDTCTYEVALSGSVASTEQVNMYGGTISLGQKNTCIGRSTTADISHINFFGTKFYGPSVSSVLVGNGSQGNVLDNNCYGCTFDVTPLMVDINGGSFSIEGGAADHVATMLQIDQVTDNPMVVRNFRVEGASRLVNNLTNGNSYIDGLWLENVTDAGLTDGSDANVPNMTNCTTLPPAIYWGSSAPIHMSNVRISNACGKVTFQIGHDASSPTPLYMDNVGVNDTTFPAQLQNMYSNGRVLLFSTNDVQVADSGSGIGLGSGRTYSSSPVSSPAISSGNAANNDAVGALVVPTGATSVARTFTDPRTYTVAPSCFAGNVTGAVAMSTTTSMTITAPAGSIVSYFCVRRD